MNLKNTSRSIRRLFRPVLATLLVVSGLITAVWMLARESCSTVKIEVTPIYDPSTSLEARARSRFEGLLKPHEQIPAHERMLRSKEVLELAIGRMKQLILRRSPSSNNNSPELAELQVHRMARAIELQEIPKTSFLLISYYHPDPKVASNMANAIAWAYEEYRQSQEKQLYEDQHRRFVLDLQTREAHIESLQKEAAELKERGGIIDPDPDRDVVIKMGVTQKAVTAYMAAKSKLLNEKGFAKVLLDRLSAERVESPCIVGPVSIWEPAEPSKHRSHANFRRLWRRLVSQG